MLSVLRDYFYNLLLLFIFINMTSNTNLLWVILINCVLVKLTYGNNVTFQDKTYDIIHFKIPLSVWQHALDIRPFPVLKSQATIVVPIHVASDTDEDTELQDEDELENDSETGDETELEDNPEIDNDNVVQEGPIQSSTTVTTPLPVTTPLQIQDEYDTDNTTEQDVAGQGIRLPCSCLSGQCGCCTRLLLPRLGMNACGNITFVPEDFIFDVKLSVNNNTVVRRRVSASDPPPICFNPRRAPFVQVCAEISNIRIRNRNAFACLNINADIAGFSIYSASFRCFGLGTSGVQSGLKPKPVSSGPAPINLFGGNDNNADRDGIFGGLLGGGGGSGSGGGIFGGGGSGGPIGAIGNAIGGVLGL